MTAKTDGRSWLSVKHRKLVTEYRDAAQHLANMELTLMPGHPLRVTASRLFVDRSQELCRAIAGLNRENQRLARANRRTLR